MKRLDPRSVIIGFLLAVIGLLSMGATDRNGRFDILEANNIIIRERGNILFRPVEANDTTITALNIDGLQIVTPGEHITIGRVGDDPHNIISISSTDYRTTLYSAGVVVEVEKEGETVGPSTTVSAESFNVMSEHGATLATLGQSISGHGGISLYDKYGEPGWGMTGKRE